MGGAEADNIQIKFLAAPRFEAVAGRRHQAGTTGGKWGHRGETPSAQVHACRGGRGRVLHTFHCEHAVQGHRPRRLREEPAGPMTEKANPLLTLIWWLF